MAAAHPAPPTPLESPGTQKAQATAEPAAGQSLELSASTPGTSELIPAHSPLARLPVEVDIVVPVREFRVRNLLAIVPGDLIETQWPQDDDMPLAAGDVQLAWSEFEVIDTQLAVRVTRLA